MDLLINQPWGLGDVIYCMQLARMWMGEGHTITWPVFPQFVEGLQRAYPDVTFCDWKTVAVNYDRQDEHDWNGYRVVPLRFNVEIMKVSYDRCMASKYEMFNLPYADWKKGAAWARFPDEEFSLYLSDMVGGVIGLDYTRVLGTPPKFNLINNFYGSESQLMATIAPGNDLPCVYMNSLQHYSLFDWAGVIEAASEIHVVSSSILYILEVLDLKQPIHLYPRQGDPKFKQVDYLFSKPYILH